MAFEIATLNRTFVFKPSKGQDIPLSDIEGFSPQQVMNFYAGSYPELTTATINGPIQKGEGYEYVFETKLGTKG